MALAADAAASVESWLAMFRLILDEHFLTRSVGRHDPLPTMPHGANLRLVLGHEGIIQLLSTVAQLWEGCKKLATHDQSRQKLCHCLLDCCVRYVGTVSVDDMLNVAVCNICRGSRQDFISCHHKAARYEEVNTHICLFYQQVDLVRSSVSSTSTLRSTVRLTDAKAATDTSFQLRLGLMTIRAAMTLEGM